MLDMLSLAFFRATKLDKLGEKLAFIRGKGVSNENAGGASKWPGSEWLRRYDDTPNFLRHNPFIRSGYRTFLNKRQCIQSIFQWNNETVNIWTHLLGLVLFIGLFVHDYFYRFDEVEPSPVDVVVCIMILVVYMATLTFSVLYHTFNCQSETTFNHLLQWDIVGVALSLSITFFSGVHYAFCCCPLWKAFYICVEAILVLAVMMFNFRKEFNRPQFDSTRIVLLCSLVVFGIVPTVHWAYLYGGLQSPVVRLLLPRVLMLFVYAGVSFTIYKRRFPECLYPGMVDYVGASHQIWHLFVLLAKIWWHETGFIYLQFRKEHDCLEDSIILAQY